MKGEMKKKTNVHEYNIKIIDNPTYGQYVDVLKLLGISEKQFRSSPEEAIAKTRNLSIDECQQLLNIITTDKRDISKEPVEVAYHIVAIATSFFLISSLVSILQMKITEHGIMNPKAYRLGNRTERILALMLLSQHLNQEITTLSDNGN